MDNKELLSKIEDYVRSCMENGEPGHDFLHIQRVRKMALCIGETVPCDLLLVEALALLHDIEDPKVNKGHSVKEFLDTLEIEEELRGKILSILPFLSFSKYPLLPEGFDIEAKIVSDADRLDAIGALGVARAFSYGGSKGRRMYGEEKSTIDHFEEKLLRLDKFLYTDKAREIAKGRMEFLRGFYQEFLKEVEEDY